MKKEEAGSGTCRRRIVRATRPPPTDGEPSTSGSNINELETRLSGMELKEDEAARGKTYEDAIEAAAAVVYANRIGSTDDCDRTEDANNATGVTDEDLFKQPAPRDECPICFRPLPLNNGEQKYQTCCGKTICAGCIYAIGKEDRRGLCPFCRSPAALEGEVIERLNKRAEGGDADAFLLLGCYYCDGMMGFPQNYRKANKLWLRAGELGSAAAYTNIGYAHENGMGVEKDAKKAKHYYELAAMGGNVKARYNLGAIEGNAGNMSRAMKHWMISAGAGFDESLGAIRECFLKGHATKDDFEKALRAHKEAKDEVKSDQREAVAVLAAARQN